MSKKLDRDIYKLYFAKHGNYCKKIERYSMVKVHEDIQKANPDEYDSYMVIEHIGKLNQDNVVAMGTIRPREEIKTPEDYRNLWHGKGR